MREEDEYHSIVLHGVHSQALDRTILWCRGRLGDELSGSNPQGRWTWTIIPGTGTIMTLPSEEMVCEMRLVAPWNP